MSDNLSQPIPARSIDLSALPFASLEIEDNSKSILLGDSDTLTTPSALLLRARTPVCDDQLSVGCSQQLSHRKSNRAEGFRV